MGLISSNSAIPSRSGSNLGGADKNALFLKVFSSEILTAFEELNVMRDLHTVRTISSGKSAQFPVTGIATAAYHTPGQSITINGTSYLSDIKHTERTISIDDMLIASTFLSNIDELKNHYDVRSIYAKELGKALAKEFDINAMKTLFAAANSVANISGETKAGTVIDKSSGGLDTADEIVAAVQEMAQTLDENDAPAEGRFAIMAPKTYYKLFNTTNVAIDKDYSNAGNADAAEGMILKIAGIKLVKSNHLSTIAELGDQSGTAASGNINNNAFDDSAFTGGADGGNDYNGDFSVLDGLGGFNGIIGGTGEAIGTVKLLDLATESEYQIDRQGHLFVAKYALGHGVLRPECAVSVKVA